MTRDPNQHPATAGQHAGRSDAERQEKITQLFLRRSKLSPDEAALLRQVFRVIIDAHHDQVWDHLRRRRLKSHRAKELYQEVFIALYTYILEHGFPDSMPGLVNEIVERRLMRNGRDEGRVPPMDAPVSSGSWTPGSVPDLDRALDLRALLKPILPLLSPELQEVAEHLKITMPALPISSEVRYPFGGMPFKPPTPGNELARTKKVPEYNPRQGQTMPLGDDSIEKPVAVLPFVGAAIGAGVVSFPRLSLEQYASLCAELALWPTRSRETLLRYHVMNEAAHRALSEHWQAELAVSSEAYAMFVKAVADYAAWLRAQRA